MGRRLRHAGRTGICAARMGLVLLLVDRVSCASVTEGTVRFPSFLFAQPNLMLVFGGHGRFRCLPSLSVHSPFRLSTGVFAVQQFKDPQGLLTRLPGFLSCPIVFPLSSGAPLHYLATLLGPRFSTETLNPKFPNLLLGRTLHPSHLVSSLSGN